MNIVQKSALVFTLIGAINWGLIGIFDFNLVSFIFGDMTLVTRIIYSLVGIAAIINTILFFVDMDYVNDMDRERVYRKN
ncbi:MAG: DUF378 domain-containing protein [Erysipelotrichaceae bacterium]|nr:DUF378 domain-containing protein [Erysipelotrichaceae bacterium]